MPVIYRTAGAWGAGAGANLTPAQIDGNFWQLVQDIADAAAAAGTPIEITNITVSGNQMTVHMANGDTYGPLTLPIAAMSFRGNWEAGINYAFGDLFTESDTLYFVQQAHLSADPFNPAAGNMSGLYAEAIMPYPSTFSVGFSFPGKPGFGISDDQAMWSYRSDRAFWLPALLTGSIGGLYVAAASDMTLLILRNDVEIGSIEIAAGQDTCTFTFEDPQQFEPGDVLRIIRPDTLDDDAADLTVTFQGKLGDLAS